MQLEADYGLRGRTHQYPQALMSWRGTRRRRGDQWDVIELEEVSSSYGGAAARRTNDSINPTAREGGLRELMGSVECVDGITCAVPGCQSERDAAEQLG